MLRLVDAISRLDLRRSWPQWLLVIIAAVAAVLLRRTLRPHSTTDYTVYVGLWFDHLKEFGFSGLATVEANYNPPFLYLLLAGSALPMDGLYVVKLIAGIFDIVGAVGIAFILYRFWRQPLYATAGGVAFLFLPEVWLNSSLWGQVDSIHTAFVVWAVWALLAARPQLAWIMYALALSFKLQSIFVLPLFGIAFLVQKHRWWQPLVGVAVYCTMLLPVLIAGRPLSDVLSVYAKQAASDVPLTLHAPNLYQWIPDTIRPLMADGGLYFGVGVVAILGVAYLRRPPGWLQLAAVFGLVVPFVLPGMHDRYFYLGAVFTVVLAALDRRYWPAAIALQLTAIIAYRPFIGQEGFALPMPAVAVLQLAAISWVVWLSLSAPSPLSDAPKEAAPTRQKTKGR